jgi:hypothetical protein
MWKAAARAGVIFAAADATDAVGPADAGRERATCFSDTSFLVA